jgi:hypothetical protein
MEHTVNEVGSQAAAEWTGTLVTHAPLHRSSGTLANMQPGALGSMDFSHYACLLRI